MPEDYPGYAKFAKLTRQEEKGGLLDDASAIGTRNGWDARLLAAGHAIRGHRLVHARADTGLATPGHDPA